LLQCRKRVRPNYSDHGEGDLEGPILETKWPAKSSVETYPYVYDYLADLLKGMAMR